MNSFVIHNINNASLLWSNTHGWIDADDDDDFDVFTLEETETLNPPLDGEWVRLSTNVKG